MYSEQPAGTGAAFDFLSANEALGPADDAGTAQIIVGMACTHGYVPGTRRIELLTRRTEGSSRGNDV